MLAQVNLDGSEPQPVIEYDDEMREMLPGMPPQPHAVMRVTKERLRGLVGQFLPRRVRGMAMHTPDVDAETYLQDIEEHWSMICGALNPGAKGEAPGDWVMDRVRDMEASPVPIERLRKYMKRGLLKLYPLDAEHMVQLVSTMHGYNLFINMKNGSERKDHAWNGYRLDNKEENDAWLSKLKRE